MKSVLITGDSSTIRQLEFNIETGELLVEFRSGSEYSYAGVPVETFEGFFDAESAGRYFSEHIKDKFVTEKIDTTKPVGVPPPVPVPDAAEFEEFLEWTPEEEEEFLKILDEDKE